MSGAIEIQVQSPEKIQITPSSPNEYEVKVLSPQVIDLTGNPLGIQGPPGPIGPRGEKGDKGDSGAHYLHVQITPQLSWTVVHNLGRNPVVLITDSMGEEVEGDIQYVDSDTLIVSFSAEFSGQLICYA